MRLTKKQKTSLMNCLRRSARHQRPVCLSGEATTMTNAALNKKGLADGRYLTEQGQRISRELFIKETGLSYDAYCLKMYKENQELITRREDFKELVEELKVTDKFLQLILDRVIIDEELLKELVAKRNLSLVRDL